MTGFFSIGLSGLNVAQQNLLVTEHNVVNANTPGFTRQRVIQGSALPSLNTSGGAVGQGVRALTTERIYDKFLVGRLNSDQAQASSLESFYSQMSQIDSLLADTNAGLTPALQGLFTGLQKVADNPSSLPARQTAISSAETLVSRFEIIDQRLSELQSQVNDRVSSLVAEVNSFATEIGFLNRQILSAESVYGQPANDLLDRRDYLIGELNKRVKVNVAENSNGTINVFLGSGQPLVIGVSVSEVVAQQASADPSKIAVGLKLSGAVQELPDALVVGGEIGGLLAFQNQGLGAAANEVGRVAASLAQTINAQHALGQDLYGKVAADTTVFQADIFDLPSPRSYPNSNNSSSVNMSVAFATPTAPVLPGLSGNFSTDLTGSDYEVSFGAGGAFTVKRLSDGFAFPTQPGGTTSFSFDGLDLTFTTAGNVGDRFTIKPYADVSRGISVNSRLSSDPGLLAAALPVRASPGVSNSGTMALSQGKVGVGYSTAALPTTLVVNGSATAMSGIAGNWQAVYADGSVLTGTGGNISFASGGSRITKVEFDGMVFDVSGNPVASDQFVIQRNYQGVKDGRNVIMLGQLQSQNTTAGGTASFQGAYSRLVADIGIRTNEAKIQWDARIAVLEQSRVDRDALSAVNLDEEAANLLKFQQAYQASAKVLDIGSKLFESVLALG